MATNLDLITDALLELGVINESETPSAEQGQHALSKLNRMLEEWEELRGIRLGWCEQTDISNTAPLPPYAERGVTLRLAIALAPSYGGAASVTPALVTEADESYRLISLKSAIKNMKPLSTSNMPQSEMPGGTYNILTDH